MIFFFDSIRMLSSQLLFFLKVFFFYAHCKQGLSLQVSTLHVQYMLMLTRILFTVDAFLYSPVYLLHPSPSSLASTSCSNCPAGSECPNTGAPVQCQAGYYSQESDGSCTPCAAGTYAASAGNNMT